MRRRSVCGSIPLASGALAASVLTPAAISQDGMTLQEMADRLRALEAANAGLQQEVRDLRSQNGQQWLSEERAAAVRGIVHDVLADADGRTSFSQAGATAGYADGFYISSADGGFTMKANLLLQTRMVWSHIPDGSAIAANRDFPDNPDTKQDRWGFDIPNAQLTLSGRLFDSEVEYMVRGAFTNDDTSSWTQQGAGPGNAQQFLGTSGSGSGRFALLDAWMRLNLTQDWSARAGQFKLPFDREFLVYDAYLLTAGRSVLSDHFSPGYSQGLELEYSGDSMRWRIAFSDGGTDNLAGPYLRLVGTDPLNSVWYREQANWAITSRVEFKLDGLWEDFREMTSPQGEEFGLLVGGAVTYQQGQNWFSQNAATSGASNGYNNWLGLTADVTANFGGASLFSSFYFAYVESGSATIQNAGSILNAPVNFNADTVTAMGFLVQGSLYVDRDWEIYGRFEYGNSNGPSGLTGSISGTTGQPFALSGFNNPEDLYLLTVGWNYYFKGQNSKWTTDFGVALSPVSYFWATPEQGLRASRNSGEMVVRTQLQLFF